LNLHLGSPAISLIDARHMAQAPRLGDVWVGVRPEHVELSREQGEDALRGIIADTLSLPPMNTMLFTIRVGDHEVHAQTSGDANHRTGDQVWLTFRQYHLFDKASGVRRPSHPGSLTR
jgi:ABC-type sugar transport system ATPase subunit